MEEIVQTLFEDGTLVGNGVVKVVRPLTQIKVPTTVQAVLASRIDRLPMEEKELLRTLAVLGREFPLGLVQRVWRRPLSQPAGVEDSELDRMLSRLQAGEFIYEQPAFSEPEYIFKHALTQEVAYRSLLIERRKQLHESAGLVLESMYADQLDDHLSELAHHYSLSSNAAKAIEYLQRSGEQAVERSANAEAIAQFTAALELLKTLPEGIRQARREIGLQLLLGGVLGVAKSPGAMEVKRAFSRAQELSIRINDDAFLFQALAGVWYHHQVCGEIEPSLEVGRQLLALAQSIEEPLRLKFAHLAMAQSLQYLGDLMPCVEQIKESERIARAERRLTSYHLGDAPPRWLAISADVFWQLGYPDQAMARSCDALAGADRLSHAYVSAVTRMFCALFCADFRHIEATMEHADAGILLSSEYGFSLVLPTVIKQRGWALVHLGAVEDGLSEIRRGVSLMPLVGGATNYLSRRFIAEAYLLAKRVEDGLSTVNAGLQDLENGKRRMDHAELYRLKGELMLQSGTAKREAESCFRAAIEVARHQQAKSWELRATMSLARLLRNTNRRDEARAMLAQIYDGFTEGFDLPDLKEAKALLEELRP
jgi:tetratricopeptide (TPR) repeat protein